MMHSIFWRLKMHWRIVTGITLVLAGLLVYLVVSQKTPFFPKPKAPFHFSPYLDLNLAVEGQMPLANTFFAANTKAIIQWPTTPPLNTLRTLTLAFASGECGKEHWGGLDANKLAQANLPALQQADVNYMISTGGSDAIFTCSSEAGMAAFINRYQSSHLLGFDFNIEAKQTPELIRQLVHQVGIAMRQHPELRFSFTLAATAANGGNSLNQTGQWVMQAIEAEGLQNHYVNLMVMNYGQASSGACVVRADRCDMAASAVRAVNNLHRKYRLPLSRIEVTPMLGINDVTSNVFTLEDARQLASFARSQGLGGLHYWSLNRDTPCVQATATVSANCHGLGQTAKLAFTDILATSVAVNTPP